MLSCQSTSNPSTCSVKFYHDDTILVNKSSSTCFASHVIPSIQGCNNESFSCMTSNDLGEGPRTFLNVAVYGNIYAWSYILYFSHIYNLHLDRG